MTQPVRVSWPVAITAADTDTRIIAGTLLPFGDVGNTSAGPVVFLPGSIDATDPAGLVLNVEHDYTRPIGRAVAIDADDQAVTATFRLAATSDATDRLTEAADGLRGGLSVEADLLDHHLDPDTGHRIVARAELTGAALVVRPAFTAAAVTTTTAAQPDPEPEPEPEQETTMDTEEMTAPVQPGRVTAAAPPLTLDTVAAALAAPDRHPDVMAALSDITYTGAGVNVSQPQWVGELWSGVEYARRLVPLFGSPRPLTSLKISGWRWATKPAGAEYSGDKAAVPSNAATTEAQETAARRWAGAHDHDRAMVDFQSPGYWESYFRAMAESYAQWTDSVVAEMLAADATDAGLAADPIAALLLAAQTVISGGGIPTVFAVASDVYGDLLAVPASDAPAFLDGALTLAPPAGNVGGVNVAPIDTLDPGTVIATDPRAASFHELGGTPIRVQAPNIGSGGVDTGLFGYAGIDVHQASAIALVTVGTPPA